MKDDRPMRRASDFHPEVLRLFDQYVHGLIDRRGFLDGAARFAVGGTSAAALLQALSPRFANAQKVAPTDTRISAQFVEFDSPHGHDRGRGIWCGPQRRQPRCQRCSWCTRTAG